MLKLYYSLAPNPMKVVLMLEEAGLPFEPIPVETGRGEQHGPELTRLNPNQKVPVLVDGDLVLFDSNAILLHLAHATGRFMPPASDRNASAAMLSWLMFVATGIGPYSGQCVHFRHFAPDPKDYAVERYLFEARRHWSILDDRLASNAFMLGDDYTIVDMAVWGWARMVPRVLGASPKDEAVWERLPNVKRLLDAVSARPAATRAEAIAERHRFKQGYDDESRRAMFRHIGAGLA